MITIDGLSNYDYYDEGKHIYLLATMSDSFYKEYDITKEEYPENNWTIMFSQYDDDRNDKEFQVDILCEDMELFCTLYNDECTEVIEYIKNNGYDKKYDLVIE